MDTATNATCGEVTYGVVAVSLAIDPDGPTGPMPPNVSMLPVLLGVGNDLVVGVGNAFDPAKSPMVPAGGSLTYTRRILVGATNDVASVSNFIYSAIFPAAALGTLTGDIDADDSADVEANLIFEGKLTPFFQDQTVPMTQVRTDRTGKFSVVLPAGEYNVSVFSPEHNDLTNVKVVVTPGTSTAVIPKLSATGIVSFGITERGSPVPAKLTFKGVDGTPDPDFSRFFTASIIDPKTAAKLVDLQASTYTSGPALNFFFTGDGTGRQILKPGKYRVFASRGIEYTVAIKDFTVVAGQEIRLDFQLERVVDTTGFVSADFHVHSGKSFDASATLEDRVRSYVAENVEVIVATEHNYINDFSPILQKLGLDKFAKGIVGNELTTSLPNPAFPNSFGHHNIFPLKVDQFAPRRGAPATEYVPSATFYDRSQLNNPGVEKVIQLNHPRSGVAGLTLIGLFNIIGFNPTQTVSPQLLLGSQLGTGTRNIDFNAMELLNGDNIGQFQQVRNDWASLINQGFIKTATAVSDSHRVVVESPGFPRSFVATPTDDPSAVKDDMITSAVRAGRVVGSSGPFIRFDIEGQPLGSLVKKTKGKVKLNITVTAPAWVPVEEVRILANGKQVMAFDATTNPRVAAAPTDPTSNQGVERFKATIKIKPKGDTYYTVEAGIKLPNAVDTNNDGVIDTGDTNGDGKIDANDKGLVQPKSPTIYAAIAPGSIPLAFTNPIFIDRNGNGKFDPPGLSATSIPTADFVRTEPIEEHVEKDYFPWAKFHVSEEVMQEFMQVLPQDQLKLVEPSRENQINEKIDDRKFEIFNPSKNNLWAFLSLRAF
jgi:hypothetical protein